MTVTRNLEPLTLKSLFLKTDIFFKELEYCFLVESTTIYTVPISYKTDHTKAKVKTENGGVQT